VNDQGYFGSVPFSFSMERVLACLHVTRLSDDVKGVCTGIWDKESDGEFTCHESTGNATLVNACVESMRSNTNNVIIGLADLKPITVRFQIGIIRFHLCVR